MYNIDYDEQVKAFHISWEEDPKYAYSIPINGWQLLAV